MIQRFVRKIRYFLSDELGGTSCRTIIKLGFLSLLGSFFAKTVIADKSTSYAACNAVCKNTMDGNIMLSFCAKVRSKIDYCTKNEDNDQWFGFSAFDEAAEIGCVDPANPPEGIDVVFEYGDDPESSFLFKDLGYTQHANSIQMDVEGEVLKAMHAHSVGTACPGKGILFKWFTDAYQGQARTSITCVSTDGHAYVHCNDDDDSDACGTNVNSFMKDNFCKSPQEKSGLIFSKTGDAGVEIEVTSFDMIIEGDSTELLDADWSEGISEIEWLNHNQIQELFDEKYLD